MKRYINTSGLTVLIFLFILISCHREVLPANQQITAINSDAALHKPYLILISLDGFRWDYVDRFHPPHLRTFVETV